MKKTLLAAVAGFVLVAAGFSAAAEAQCFRSGYQWSCGRYPPPYRPWAAGYGYPHPYGPSGWGYPRPYRWGFPSFGPRTNGGNGP